MEKLAATVTTSPSVPVTRTLVISRRVWLLGLSAWASTSLSLFTRARMRWMSSAIMNSMLRWSPSGRSFDGT